MSRRWRRSETCTPNAYCPAPRRTETQCVAASSALGRRSVLFPAESPDCTEIAEAARRAWTGPSSGPRPWSVSAAADRGETPCKYPSSSNGSAALQTLQQLLASLQAGAANPVETTPAAAPTGQNVQGVAPPSSSLTPPNPSNQFAAQALAFLTSLQDVASNGGAASTGTTSTSNVALGLTDLNSALNQLSQALNGISSAQSTGATALSGPTSTTSAGAAPLLASTASALVQALDQLGTALESLDSASGAHHHHHHHHGGETGSATASASTDTTTSTASLAATALATTSAGASTTT